MTEIDSFSDEPFYTIKVVHSRTGIKPVTLRAWERRYQLLEPTRMDNGYRLYSERDIQLLIWVQRKLDSGMSISQVVELFKQMRSKDIWPETIQIAPPKTPKLKPPRPARDYAEMLYGAMVAHYEDRANTIMEEVQKYFDLVTIFQEVITPAMELIGDAWYRGEVLVATEHLATGYVKGKLRTIMQNMPTIKESAMILVGCGPGETHELAAMMFAVLLRQEGFFVEYLGPDLPVEDLIDYSTIVRPKLLVLSVGQEDTAYLMRGFAEKLGTLRGKPKLAYGGRYFDDNEAARTELGGYYLGKTFNDGVEKVKHLIMAS